MKMQEVLNLSEMITQVDPVSVRTYINKFWTGSDADSKARKDFKYKKIKNKKIKNKKKKIEKIKQIKEII